MPTVKKKFYRIPVGLTEEDNKLMIKLRSTLEAKDNKRWSIADIVRQAIKVLADKENIVA